MALDIGLNLIDYVKPKSSNIDLVIDKLYHIDEKNWKGFGTPSYKLKFQKTFPLVEKTLQRLKFDDDADITSIFGE